jgi:hypothetical protein
MASKHNHEREQWHDRTQWLIDRLRELCAEDDFAHGLGPVNVYPEFDSRRLSILENDLRDWGFVYGLAFGLAISQWPDEPHVDDPARPSLVSILPKLGPVVGRPWLARVPTDHEGL